MHAGSNSQKSKYDGTQVLGNFPPFVTKRQNKPFLSLTPCLHRHPGRADADSKIWRHPHGRMRAQQPRNAPHPRLLDGALQLCQHNRTHHRKKRRRNKSAHNPNGDGLTAKTARAWQRTLLVVSGDQPGRGQSGAGRTDKWERAE